MGLCGQKDETHDIRTGIATKRRCRDVWCLLLFLVYWAGMFVVATAGFKYGDPKLLVIPKDYLGNFCGVDNRNTSNAFSNMLGKPNLYYLDPFDLSPTSKNVTMICVESCPNVTSLTRPENATCKYDIRPTAFDFLSQIQAKNCSPYTYKSKAILNRCVPLEAIPSDFLNNTISFGKTTVSLNSLMTYGKDSALQAISDLYITWPVFAIGAGSAVIISFAWLFFAHYIVAAFVWSSVILINILFMLGTIVMYFYWNSRKVAFDTNTFPSGLASVNTKWGNYSTSIPFLETQTEVAATDVRNALVIFILLLVFTILILLITIAMIKRLKMAIEIIHEASKVFLKIPGLSI
jgi:hypothetical protein